MSSVTRTLSAVYVCCEHSPFCFWPCELLHTATLNSSVGELAMWFSPQSVVHLSQLWLCKLLWLHY